MKTSKILMVMALPVAFAACTSEDVLESNQNNNLESRKALSEIEVVMGADSRFAQSGEGWIFNDGDAFGAALVDVPNNKKETNPINNYTLTNYIQTNYQYAKGEGNTWTTPARMVEGNYVFYAPYNPNHLSRKPIEVITPLAQVLDVKDGDADAYSTINNLLSAENPNPMFVAYQFLAAENQATSISVDMKHIFAYPEVAIVNKSEEDVEIFKFVISTGAATFPVKAPLNIGDNTKSASNGVGGVVGSLFNYGSDATKYGTWIKDVKNGLKGYTADLLNVTGAPQSNLIVVEIPEGLTIEAGETETFNVVMPAKQYSGFTIYAYTSDEEGYELTSNKTATFFAGKRYPKEEYNNGNVVASKAGKIMTSTITEDSEVKTLDNNFPVVVSTTAELLAAVENCTESLRAIVTNEEVAINQALIDAMRQNDKTLSIEGDITIEGGEAAADALVIEENIRCANNAIIEGFVTLKAGSFAEVEVLEDADLTVDGATVGTINNYGTATVKTGSSAINNYGTLNVSTNNGNITVKYVDGVTTSIVNVKTDMTFAKDIEGTWNVDSGKTLTLSAAKSLKGTLNVNGTLAGEKLTVKAAKGLASTLSVNGTLRNNVELDGHKKVATDTEDADKLASMEINSSAKIYGTIKAVSTASNMYDYNKVTIADGAFFVSQSSMIDIANVKAVYEYEGNISKKADAATLLAKIPAQANTVVLDDILATEELPISFGAKYVNVNEILCTSNLYTGIDCKKLTVGNVILAGTSHLNVLGDLKVTGDFNAAEGTYFTFGAKDIELNNVTSGIKTYDNITAGEGLDLSQATSITINGNIIGKNNIILGGADIVLKGTSIDMDGKFLLIEPSASNNNVAVESNLTVKNAIVTGTNEGAANNVVATGFGITVYNGKKLTIAETAKVCGYPTIKVTFESSRNSAKHNGTENAVALNASKVENKGEIHYAAVAYNKTDNLWWLGNAAWTGDTAPVPAP